MLNFNNKIEIFKNYLEIENGNYGDKMKNEIYFYFFENDWDFVFLEELVSEEEITSKIEFVVSKMILNEDKEGIENIIFHYFYNSKKVNWQLSKN